MPGLHVLFAALLFVGLLSCRAEKNNGFISIPLSQHDVPLYEPISAHGSGHYAQYKKPPLSKRNYEGSTLNVPLQSNTILVGCEITITTSTTTQNILVQLDTGSTLLAVPDASCKNCGSSPNPYLKGADYVLCTDVKHCSESRCNGKSKNCGFEVTYVDGSDISGPLAFDQISLGGLTANAVYGAISTSTNSFEDGLMDGIMGFAYNNPGIACEPNCVPPFFTSLVQQNNISSVFSVLIDYQNGGSLTLGGYDPALLNGALNYTSVITDDFYTVSLHSISLGPYTVAAGSFGSVIVDSGTTLTLLPPAVFNSLKSYFQTYYSNLLLVSGSETFWNDYCLLVSTLIGNYPTIYFAFNGVTVKMGPENYIYQTFDSKGVPAYCFGIAPSSNGDTILGDTFMRGILVVFNQEKNILGFGPTSAVPPYPTNNISKLHTNMLLLAFFPILLWCITWV